MDSTIMDVDFADFLTEIDPIANAEFPTGLLGEEFEVDGMVSMDLEWPQDEGPVSDFAPLNSLPSDLSLPRQGSPAQTKMDSEVEIHIDLLLESMKRSEATRQQIIRHQLFMQPNSQVVAKPVSFSMDLFGGPSSKLTTSLEQSRSILMSYMQQLQNL